MNRRKFFGLIGAACGYALVKPLSVVVPTPKIIGLKHRCYTHFVQCKRKVFYQYPNGSAPLTGLLSMLKEDEGKETWWK